MCLSDTPVLILPGIGDSGPGHWQSLWQRSHPHFQRVVQSDWNYPVCGTWMDVLETAVGHYHGDVLVVAHSLGCLLLAHWAQCTRLSIKGALLVAVPDPDGDNFPSEAQGYAPVPYARFAFPSIVVASSNDPYASLEFDQKCAAAWGSRFVDIGGAGHINAGSGFGEWREGLALLHSLGCGVVPKSS